MAERLYTANGVRVPSVTTVNKIGQDSGGLIHWAWNEGMHGRDYRASRGEAAEAGSVGHLLCEAAIKGQSFGSIQFPTEAARKLGYVAWQGFDRWHKTCGVGWIDAEVSLVSEKYEFGGTIDAVGVAGNSYVLGDWKAGRLYPDQHITQLAAYARLFEECTGHNVRALHLCRFNRETGDFTHHAVENEDTIERCWQMFLLKRQLYDHLKWAKKL